MRSFILLATVLPVIMATMDRIDRLRIGTGGIPLSTFPRNTTNGIARIRELGLGALELEFVHGITVKENAVAQVRAAAKDNDVVLTCHGSYYINLHSDEQAKQMASMNRILDAARRLHECGGYSCVFHAAFYGKNPQTAYSSVQQSLRRITATLQDEGNTVWVRPETTGKPSQFGTVAELVKLSQDVEQVLPCVDFSHLHARTNGKYNTTEEFTSVLTQIETGLGKEALQHMHIHLSGIAYGEKGEKHHLLLDESDMRYKDLIAVWKEFKIRGVVVCESPNLEDDAQLIKKTYDAL